MSIKTPKSKIKTKNNNRKSKNVQNSTTSKCCKEIAIVAGMALLSFLLFSLVGFIFTGCAGKEYVEVIKVAEVNIPIKCDLPIPVLDGYLQINDDDNTNIAQQKRLRNELNIHIYAEELKMTLKQCEGKR
jgi:hypothetical protein